MKKNIYTVLILFLSTNTLFGQSDTIFAGALTHEKYFENPRAYLNGLDSSKLNSEILIDRSLFDEKILNCNGLSTVSTLEYGDFYKIYQDLKYSHIDINHLPEFDTLLDLSRLLYNGNQINTIFSIDFNFKKIKSEALLNSDFVETETYLTDQKATESSFSNHRAFAFSCLKHNIFGEKIKFLIHQGFHFNNQNNLIVQKIEIDFGNGQGFQSVTQGETVNVNYTGESNYVEMKMKITYFNSISNNVEFVYAHSSIFRQSSEGIPAALNLQTLEQKPQSQVLGEIEKPKNPHVTFCYPELVKTVTTTNICINKSSLLPCIYVPFVVELFVAKPYTLDVTILFNDNNKSGKLRRPFIMCDGFDPGNKRNYWETVKDNPDLLPKDKDLRGLFHMLDGQRSPWDLIDRPDEKNANLVEALRKDGYDLIFINFRDGAGDILENAKSMRGLFNDVLNGPIFRDNKTEEAILVGPSMGGIITRIALVEMEQKKEEHYVKTWLSLDSPHKGANIPLGLQLTMQNMSKSSLPPIYKTPLKALDALNTDAAKQLLLYHYIEPFGNIPNATRLHNSLQGKLLSMGFPIVSKNYSITNGGTELLYPNGEETIGLLSKTIGKLKILDLKIFKINSAFSPISYTKVFDEEEILESRGGRLVLNVENCPGGWIGALYTLNKNPNNNDLFDIINPIGKRFEVSTFIPTTSSFGVPLNSNNIQKTWKQFTTCNDSKSGLIQTPFDGIYGMEGENQEHTKISESTKFQVITNWFHPDFANASHPIVRSGLPIHQTVSKPVAFVAKETISFGGNGNTFEFKSTTDATVLAGKSITLSVGTIVKPGAKVIFKIEPVDYSTTAKMSYKPIYISKNPNEKFTHESIYANKRYDYSQKNQAEVHTSKIEFNIYPNPSSDLINIDFAGMNEQSFLNINIINSSGKEVFKDAITQNGNYAINISSFASGIYIVKISNSKILHQSKLVKL